VQATNFINNITYNSNGGAIALINPSNKIERLFLTDLDKVHYAPLPTESNMPE
jgi:hypothetical protein